MEQDALSAHSDTGDLTLVPPRVDRPARNRNPLQQLDFVYEVPAAYTALYALINHAAMLPGGQRRFLRAQGKQKRGSEGRTESKNAALHGQAASKNAFEARQEDYFPCETFPAFTAAPLVPAWLFFSFVCAFQ
jgi:hypothetical protein